MAVVKIEPTMDHPVPFSTDETKLDNFMEEVAVAAGTAELLEELGAPLEVDPSTLDREKALIDAVAKQQQAAPLTNYTTALAASAFLKTYGQNLAFDVGQVRAALTNKLLEIANCGDTKYELRALELLGKSVALFTDRVETEDKTDRTADEIKRDLTEKLRRLGLA